MSWRLKVRHTTTYQYSGVVHASYNEARISPLDTAQPVHARAPGRGAPGGQPVPLPRLLGQPGPRVRPPPAPHRAHRRRQSSLVETAQRTPNLDDTVAWDAIDAPGLTDRFFEYLDDTRDDRVRRRRSARSRASCARRRTRRPRSRSSASGSAAHVEYETGTTSVSTTAVEVLRAGRGVCQDYAHLGIAVLRAAGIPARYASGYLYPDELGGVIGETHQRREPRVARGVGRRLAPARSRPAARRSAERHVLVARGRDYADVAPLKGVYHGGPSHALDVAVELTRVA